MTEAHEHGGPPPADRSTHLGALRARQSQLDACAALARAVAEAKVALLDVLVELWATSGWRAAGARSARDWLTSSTALSPVEVRRAIALARRCHEHPDLHDAVRAGRLPIARAELLALAATAERSTFLADSLDALLRASDTSVHDDDFAAVVAHWSALCDQELAVRPVHRHRLTLTPRLFGGGELHGDLSPSAFHTVAAALDAFTQDPDPADAPHRRTAAERRADALDDLAHHALTHVCDGEVTDAQGVDGTAPDDGWTMATTAAERLLCDARLRTVLLSGRRGVVDANAAAERFSAGQRVAIAARDRHCTFPTCRRRPRHCDVHHVVWRSHGGETTTGNGALLCRFHHRFVHEHGWDLRREAGAWVAIDPGGRVHRGSSGQPVAVGAAGHDPP